MKQIIICRNCEYSGRESDEYPCETCHHYENFKKKKQLTNADKIRSMLDFELAEFLAETELHGSQGSYKDYLDWLKSPATD